MAARVNKVVTAKAPTNHQFIFLNIDLENIKEELTDYIDIKIQKGFKEEIDILYKKVIKDKNDRSSKK